MTDMQKFSRQRIEAELDARNLRARAYNGNFWDCRRNGATKLWKTRPNAFRIPVKIGFRSYGYITETSEIGRPGDGNNFDFIINSIV